MVVGGDPCMRNLNPGVLGFAVRTHYYCGLVIIEKKTTKLLKVVLV